jgi:hypothetical protein
MDVWIAGFITGGFTMLAVWIMTEAYGRVAKDG